MLSVFTGKNGVGKTKFLNFVRHSIVNENNKAYPNIIVRVLTYGEETDNYDPDLTVHPLVDDKIIESYWGCSFKEWESLFNHMNTEIPSSFFRDNLSKENFESFMEKASTQASSISSTQAESKLSPQTSAPVSKLSPPAISSSQLSAKSSTQAESPHSKEKIVKKYFINYYFHFLSSNKNGNLFLKKDRMILFLEFKRYFRRRILKKICYGSLEQLLNLNMRYQFEIDRINDSINNSDLEFPYNITINISEKTNKSDVRECIIFESVTGKKGSRR